MNARNIVWVGITLILATVLAACTTPEPTSTPVEGHSLEGTEWQLVALRGEDPIAGKTITLRFEQTSLKGSGGCNTYGGSYTASADSLSLSDLYWTEMACMEPEGIMEQEQAYLSALNTAARYQLDGDRLALYDEAGTEILVFATASGQSSARVTPAPTATVVTATPTRVPPTPTAVATATATPEPPTATPQVIEPPTGFRRYVHGPSGVSLWVPESWTIIEPGPHGGSPILQSYPQDKYVGGEAREPGDTKCDLTVHPPETTVEDVLEQIGSGPLSTILSEQEIVLQSGQMGWRFEINSMGNSLSMVTEVNEQAVVLTCFGELEPFDEIAATLYAADIGATTSLSEIEPAAALIATIETQESLATGAVVNARFTLTNTSSEGFFVLKWFTPLEGLAGDIFLVQRDGVELAYHGKLVKRAAPTSEDYVWIDAGKSVSAEIDLAEGYDFSQTGQYTVQFRSPRLSHTARTAEEQADSVDELEGIQIPSDPVSVTIG